ncbi:MAG: zf-HC2 domain-containing protein [Pyrinomonadaceae bacterium]|nr:zf-HC2 domain-containing protein [Pyrinomonadaceae bacterium]
MSEHEFNQSTGGAKYRTQQCDRAEQLVAYLYGETDPEETRSYTEHLSACAPCRDEMAAFRDVREEVRVWQAEALRVAPFPLNLDRALTSDDGAPVSDSYINRDVARPRSVFAALREFFTLSPLWFQTGTVAATLAVCALAAFSLARTEVSWDNDGLAFRTGVPTRVITEDSSVKGIAESGVSQQQVDELVAKHTAELNVLRSELGRKEELLVAAQSAGDSQPERVQPSDASVQSRPDRRRQSRTLPRRPRDEQFARVDADDEDLPRLSDLLRDVH